MSRLWSSVRVLAAVALAIAAGTTSAATIITNASLGYYNSGLGDLGLTIGLPLFPGPNGVPGGDPTINPAAAPNVAGVANLGTWLTNAAPTGGTWSGAPVAVPGTWAINDETAIVYEIQAGTGLTNVHIDLGVDNGIFVWLNGTFLFGALAPGGSNLNEYDIDIPGTLTGTNFLQILREDHGGVTGYDILVTADQSVPEPSSLLLLGAALAGLGWFRRRR